MNIFWGRGVKSQLTHVVEREMSLGVHMSIYMTVCVMVTKENFSLVFGCPVAGCVSIATENVNK